MSNDLTCKETLNVDEPTNSPLLRGMPQTATTGRAGIPATQLPQQGPLQIPAHFLTQTALVASGPNSPARLTTGNATNQAANMNSINHALLQQQIINQMDANSTQTLFRDWFALQNQNQSRIVQNVTRPAPSKTATPGVVVNTNQIQRPQPSVTPSITGLPRSTFTPTLQQNQIEQQYQHILQQASQIAREKEHQRLQAEAKAAVEKQKYEEQQRAMKAKMEMEKVRAANQQMQANSTAGFVNGISTQHRPQVAVQPNRPVAPGTPSALQQAQQQTQQAQQVIQQALLNQIFGGMSGLSTLDQARAFHKQITSNLTSSYQQPSPPIQTSQQSLATSQLLSHMGGQSQLNMAASHALSQSVQNALQQVQQQASSIISQPTTSYQQPVLPTASHPLFSSQQMTPHVTPTNNLFHGTTSSPRPQPSILRRGINAGPSPGVKRRLDDSRPASGNGTATPPTEISKAHRVLHLNDENRDSPLDENGDSPTKKRTRKQTFETEGQDAVKMFQQANAAPKIAQPKRRGRPPRTDDSQKVQSVYLDLDMAASASATTKPRSHHKKKANDENDLSRLTVPSQGPLIVHSPQTAIESTSAKPSPREEKPKEKTRRRDYNDEPDFSGLEEGVAGAVKALVEIRRRKAKQLSTRNFTWKTMLRLQRGPLSTYKGRTREKIEDEVEKAQKSLDQIIIRNKLDLLDDPFFGHCFIVDHAEPVELNERLKYLLVQEKANFISEKCKKRLKKYLRRCYDEEMKEMMEEAGKRGVFDYEQMAGPGDSFYEKKTSPKKSKTRNDCLLSKFDPFLAIATTLRQAEADFILSFTQSQEVPKKTRKGKENDKKKNQEEDQKPDLSKFLLPIKIPGGEVVSEEEKSGISDGKISRAVYEAIDCMLTTLDEGEKQQENGLRKEENKEKREKRRSLKSLLVWAQMEFTEQLNKRQDGKTDCICPADALGCTFEDLKSCPSCSYLIKTNTKTRVEEKEISKDISAHGDIRKDSIQRWSKQFSTILQEFEVIVRDFHPTWHRRIEEERRMDYDPEDSAEMQEWKRQRRFETFICGFVYELPKKPSELNDSCNDCPTPWHVNRAMGPLSPFWKGPTPGLNGIINNGPIKKDIDPEWKPLRWPNAVIEEDIPPLDSYGKYRLELADEEVNKWTEQIDNIINKFSKSEDWLGTSRSSLRENDHLTSFSCPSTSATPEISNSRRKLAFSNNSFRKSTSSPFGSNEHLAGGLEDCDNAQNHKNNRQTSSSPIALEIQEMMKKYVEFIKEPLAGYVQQMEPTIDLLQQNLQIYSNDLWQNGEILEEFEHEEEMDDQHSSGECSDDL